MTASPFSPVLFLDEDHDHARCVAAALGAAEELCRKRGARFTALRRRVLELIWSSHRPVGAYALLDLLREQGPTAPPTVYRALDFLLEHGLIHRLASLNAYVGCCRPGKAHAGQFLICESCQNLVELSDEGIFRALYSCARQSGFEMRQPTVEILGVCPRCRPSEEKALP